ncbi:MAG: hypothetical protein IPI44_18405 [Sulfuritalea sp.]|nr:hypothetical protein [Sulfuritalea sp.]
MLAAEPRIFGGHESLAGSPGWLGVALFGLTLAVLISIFQGEHVNLDHITPGIFIPPVGMVVIPVAGRAVARGAALSPARSGFDDHWHRPAPAFSCLRRCWSWPSIASIVY